MRKIAKKSQVSIEFMIFITLALVVLAVFTVMIIMYINAIYFEREKIMAGRIIDEVRNEIDVAARVRDGYTRMIELSPSVGGWGYNLTFDRRYVTLVFETEAEQGEITKGLSADVTNSNPPADTVIISTHPDLETKVGMVIQKKDEMIYVCSFEDYHADGEDCL